MAAPRRLSAKDIKPRGSSISTDKETQQEFDRQQKLLAAEFDKRMLKGNAVTEEWRHYKVCTGLNQKEKREKFEFRQEKLEMLKALQKVKQDHTGHYDESKSPMENIQQALRCKTPTKNTRLTASRERHIKKVKSQEASALLTKSTFSSDRQITTPGKEQRDKALMLNKSREKRNEHKTKKI